MTVEWIPPPEDMKAAAKSVVAHIDSIILGLIEDSNLSEETRNNRDDNEVPYSTDGDGKSWRDRPPLL